MKFSGLEIKNFRSIGNEYITISPIRKCNIIVGQNNIGKSNILLALKIISEWSHNRQINLDEIDFHKRQKEIPIQFKLHFEPEEFDPLEIRIINGNCSRPC